MDSLLNGRESITIRGHEIYVQSPTTEKYLQIVKDYEKNREEEKPKREEYEKNPVKVEGKEVPFVGVADAKFIDDLVYASLEAAYEGESIDTDKLYKLTLRLKQEEQQEMLRVVQQVYTSTGKPFFDALIQEEESKEVAEEDKPTVEKDIAAPLS